MHGWIDQQSADEEEKQAQPPEEQQPTAFTKMVEEKVTAAVAAPPARPPTICEVPEDLAEGNEGAYIPKVVCIGPLFDSKRGTATMLRLERYKWRCVRRLVTAAVAAGHRHRGGGGGAVGGDGAPEDSAGQDAWSAEQHAPLLRQCFYTMMRLVPRIRASYYHSTSGSGSIVSSCSEDGGINVNNVGDEHLALTMLLDGCFVLRRLLMYALAGGHQDDGGDYDDDRAVRFGRCWVWGTVKRDLLLLSNQVPFFVVRRLFKLLIRRGSESDDVLVQCGLKLFGSLHPRPLHSSPMSPRDVHHLLHLFYLSVDLPPASSSAAHHSSSSAAEPASELLTWWVPCAKELEEAGVKFKPRTEHAGGARSFLDVSFRGGALEIPPLQLFDYSAPLFRNLVALEQTYPGAPGRVTAYAIFMDCLVKTPEDVRILHRAGVLLNHMNGDRDDAALGFFSGLCAQAHTAAGRNYLAGVMEDVNRYQSGRWPKWRAALARDYFTNPWVTTAVVAGAIGVALTIVQTFYAVYPYYNPRN